MSRLSIKLFGTIHVTLKGEAVTRFESDLATGYYDTYIYIDSNDPNEPQASIHVYLTVERRKGPPGRP